MRIDRHKCVECSGQLPGPDKLVRHFGESVVGGATLPAVLPYEIEAGTNFGAWLCTIARYQMRTETSRLRRFADYHTREGPAFLWRELERGCDEPPERWTTRIEHLRDLSRFAG